MSAQNFVNVIDPRLNALDFSQENNVWSIFKGASSHNTVAVQANSYSTAGINFDWNTQSEKTLIDRRMYCKAQFLMTFTGTADIGKPLLNSESDALRAFPLSAITNTLKVTINGSTVESQYASSLQALLRYNCSDKVKSTDLSMSPSMLDNMQRYEDGVGGIRNPLSLFQNSSGKNVGRGAFMLDEIVNPVSPDAGVTVLTATVKFSITEPLLVSPMLYKSTDLESGLLGVSNMGVKFGFNGNLERVWSRSPSGGVNILTAKCSIGAGSTTPPQMLVSYLTPPLLSMSQIPKQIDYQYYQVKANINDMNTVLNTGQSGIFTANSQQLSTVPRCIYIYATRPDNTKTYLTTDTFFGITSLSLNYLNQAGQFSSMNQQQLYQMCVKNGLDQSFSEWSGKTVDIGASRTAGNPSVDGLCGSVLKIDISDLAVSSAVASGQNLNSQLQFTIGLENLNRVENLGVQITTIIVYDGLMSISNGNMSTRIGVIGEKDIIETRLDRQNYIDWRSAHSIYAGGMGDKMGHLSAGKCEKGSRKVPVNPVGCYKKPSGKKKGGELLTRDQLKRRMFD